MSHPTMDNEETLSEVNVIPLADLSLVLLIILMVLSPMITQALIQINAAKAAAALTRQDLPDAKPETPVIVSIEPGLLKLNGVVMKDDIDLAGRLEGLLLTRKDRSVNLTAAPMMTHGGVVHIMDVVRRHGAESLVMLKWDPSAPGAAQ
jgi:biopolymer transport protein ExbD